MGLAFVKKIVEDHKISMSVLILAGIVLLSECHLATVTIPFCVVVCLGGKWLSLAGFGGVSDSKSMKLTRQLTVDFE